VSGAGVPPWLEMLRRRWVGGTGGWPIVDLGVVWKVGYPPSFPLTRRRTNPYVDQNGDTTVHKDEGRMGGIAP